MVFFLWPGKEYEWQCKRSEEKTADNPELNTGTTAISHVTTCCSPCECNKYDCHVTYHEKCRTSGMKIVAIFVTYLEDPDLEGPDSLQVTRHQSSLGIRKQEATLL